MPQNPTLRRHAAGVTASSGACTCGAATSSCRVLGAGPVNQRVQVSVPRQQQHAQSVSRQQQTEAAMNGEQHPPTHAQAQQPRIKLNRGRGFAVLYVIFYPSALPRPTVRARTHQPSFDCIVLHQRETGGLRPAGVGEKGPKSLHASDGGSRPVRVRSHGSRAPQVDAHVLGLAVELQRVLATLTPSAAVLHTAKRCAQVAAQGHTATHVL